MSGTPTDSVEAVADPAGFENVPRWVQVCPVENVTPDRGVAALIGPEQVAIFLLAPVDPTAGADAPTEVYAIDNRDPYSGANVMARGLVGSAGDRPTVASPIFKQRFDLRDGTCLDGDLPVRPWSARIEEGWIEVEVTCITR